MFLFIHGASGRGSVEHMLISFIILLSNSNLISGGTTSGRQKDSLNFIFLSITVYVKIEHNLFATGKGVQSIGY